jgi:hypothetical protein
MLLIKILKDPHNVFLFNVFTLRAAQYARVRAFLIDAGIDFTDCREWAYILADLGAVHLPSLDDKDSMFGLLRYILSTGHEFMSILKALLLLMEDHGLDLFAGPYGFKSPHAAGALFGGIETHICRDYILRVVRPTMMHLLISEYKKTHPNSGPVDVDELTPKGTNRSQAMLPSAWIYSPLYLCT